MGFGTGLPTKELFASYGYTEGVYGEVHGHPAASIKDGERAMITFRVPHDFTSTVSAQVILVANWSKSDYDVDLFVSYGMSGERPYEHEASDETSTYNFTADRLAIIDITSLLEQLAAGDQVGVEVVNNETGLYYIDVLGVRLRYN